MRRILHFSEEQIAELEEVSQQHPTPHVRERARAVLKVAQGHNAVYVAQQGFKPRHPETVRYWCYAYLARGLAGLISPSLREHESKQPPPDSTKGT